MEQAQVKQSQRGFWGNLALWKKILVGMVLGGDCRKHTRT